MKTSDRVLQRLRAAGVRPSVLARALSVNKSTASLMLSGKRGIPIWHLDAIAALLNVTVPDLFTIALDTQGDPPPHAPDPRFADLGHDIVKAADALLAVIDKYNLETPALPRRTRKRAG